jgi:PAS domain S-box-containing protein
MKVLYIGSERSEAQAVANALRTVDEGVSVLWASQLENAANWLGENRGLDALVMDAPIDGASCLVVQKQLRRLALPPAVIFLVPDGITPTLDSLHPGSHYLRRNESLPRDLPIVVTRALESAARTDLQQKLSRATAAREDAEHRQQAAADQLAALQAQYEVGMARAAAAWDMVDEQLRTAAREVASARQREESTAADVARLTQRESELSSQLADAADAHNELACQLHDARSAVEAAQAQAQHERAAAASQLRDRERDFETQLARAIEQRQHVEAGLNHALSTQHDVEAQLADAVGARSDAERRHAAAMNDVARLTTREAELNDLLTETTSNRDDLNSRLAATQAAFDDAATRATRERLVASKKAAEREAELDGHIQRERMARTTIEQTLANVTSALDQVRRDHQSALADRDRLIAREAELAFQLTELQANRVTLEQAVADAEASVADAEASVVDAEAALRDAEQRHESALTAAAVEREGLIDCLNKTQSALDDAMTRASSERLAARKKAAEREAEFDGQIHRERTARAMVEQTLTDVTGALDQVRRDHQSAATDRDRLSAREADLASQLTELESSRVALEQSVADAEAALRDAEQRHEGALAAAANERQDLSHSLRQTQSALDDAKTRATRERTARATVEQTLAGTEAALREEQRRHEIAVAAAAKERDALSRSLSETQSALDQASSNYQSATADVERLSRRESDLVSALADMCSTRDTLERRLGEATSALEHERSDRATLAQRLESTEASLDAVRRDYQSAKSDIERLTSHESDLRSELADVQATRDTLEHELSDTTCALESTRGDLESARANIDALTQREAQLASQLADTETALDQMRLDYQSAAADVARLTQREADLASQLVAAQATRHTLERQLTDANTAIREAAVRETELDEHLQQERTAHAELDQAVADAKAAFRDAQAHHETVLAAAATERHRLVSRLGETDSALEQVRQDFTAATSEIERLTAGEADLASQLADAQAIRSTLEQTLTDTRARFVQQRQQLEIQLAQAQLEHESYSSEMDERQRALSIERDTLQQSLTLLQNRASQLQESLTASVEAFEVSRGESHRLFDHAGVAMFRCTRDGVLADVNRALTTLLGRRTYELASADFAAAVFEAPQALTWLIERCLSTRSKESIETTWRRQDGGRLFVRLSARSLSSGVIEVVAEDLTRLRVLEERLGQAQRMEALGRLASEVAVTCGSLLANIREQGREWVSEFPTHSDARQRGGELFAEVGRAVGFLQELAACGDEQARTPMLVDLNTLVRDLEPVLKNVVGADVEVALRDTSTPLNVDVNTERIERLLVNLASYGRGRMPAGGRLRIELGTSVVDRHFSAKHPNVRLGLHALITVTETRRAQEEDGPSPHSKRRATGPGVDFATLQGLVSECGGHLWMKVHPLGEMVAKIRLPLVTPRDQRAPRAITARAGRERQAARWFQS